MSEHKADFSHLTIINPLPCDDSRVLREYEDNFGVTFPDLFADFLLAANKAVLNSLYLHPELSRGFPIWRVISVGSHRFRDKDDLLVHTEHAYYNDKLIPRKVVIFGWDYHLRPIYLDLTVNGAGRVMVHAPPNYLPRPAWADADTICSLGYIADSFGDYICRLVPDPNPDPPE